MRETNISTRLYAKGSYKEVHGQKTWNKDGEPGSNGEPVLTMKRLYDLLLEEVLLCGNFDMEKAVHALMSLSKPVKKVYDAPMVRTVCRVVPFHERMHVSNLSALQTRVESAAGHPETKRAKHSEGRRTPHGRGNGDDTLTNSFQVEVHVYASRLLFYLIAFEPLKAVMSMLIKNDSVPENERCGARCTVPIQKQPEQPVYFRRSTSASRAAAATAAGGASSAQPPSPERAAASSAASQRHQRASNDRQNDNELPDGWIRIASSSQPGKFWYFHSETQKKTWKKPRRAAAKKASKTAKYNSAGATEMLDYDDPFSLGGLLRAQENTG